MELPKNVDMSLVHAAQDSNTSAQSMRKHASDMRRVARTLPMSDESRGRMLMEASKYKRVAQYMERIGGAK